MLTSKDPAAILRPLEGRLASVSIVPAPGHDAHRPAEFAPFTSLAVRSFGNVAEAFAALPPEGDVLIAGSLYLAGDVLRRNSEAPD
jgi:dihydrofolate synthase/folylpolyglutamate synthase